MLTTIGLFGSMIWFDSLWCGDVELGLEPTMTKLAVA